MATNEESLFPAQQEGDSGPLNIGFKGNLSSRVIPLGATQDMNHVRFEGGAIRRDFGWASLGMPAETNIQALGEHGVYIAPGNPDDTGRYQYYLYRIISRNEGAGNYLVIQTFNTIQLEWEDKAILQKRGFRGKWDLQNPAPTPNPSAGEAQFDSTSGDLAIHKLDSDGTDWSSKLNNLLTGGKLRFGGQLWNIASGTLAGDIYTFVVAPSQTNPTPGQTYTIYFTYPTTVTPEPDYVKDVTKYVSTVSIQDALAVATGSDPIMVWLNQPQLQLQNNPFTPNTLTKAQETAEAIISDGTEFATDYQFTYTLQVPGTVTVDSVTATIEVFVNDVLSRGERTITVDKGSQLASIFSFEDELVANDKVKVLVKSLIGNGTTPRHADFPTTPDFIVNGQHQFETNSLTTTGIAGDTATFNVRMLRDLNVGSGSNPNDPDDSGSGSGGGTGDEGVEDSGPDQFQTFTPWTFSIEVKIDGGAWTQIYQQTGILQDYFELTDFSLPLGGTPTTSIQYRLVGFQNATTEEAFFSLDETQENRVDWQDGAFGVTLNLGDLTYVYNATGTDFFGKVTPENFPGSIVDPDSPVNGAPVDAPRARYLGSFGDRLFGLWEGNDRQVLNASADGNILSWVRSQTAGPTFLSDDSANLSLIDNRVDPIDDLQWLLPVSSGIAVLARQRSFMRISETGNPLLSVAATHWVEGVGVESPYAACQVENGVMLLGSNRMVYYMTADRMIPVGEDIQEELIKHYVPGQRAEWEIACCAYDGVFQEWYLAVPWDGSQEGQRWFVFDLKHFLQTQETRWYRRSVRTHRIAGSNQVIRNNLISGGVEVFEGVPRPIAPDTSASAPKERSIVFSQPNLSVQYLNEVSRTLDGAAYSGYWESPTLNRGPMGNEATLRTVGFQYSAEAGTNMILELSGDGGQSYTERHTLALSETRKQVRRIRKAVNTTGYDLRFRVLFPGPEIVKVFSFYPSIVERGRLVL